MGAVKGSANQVRAGKSSRFWKVSMGPGAYFGEFRHILSVLDWIRQGLVLIHRNCGPIGSGESQGDKFVDDERIGDYFYLCHGNESPCVLLLGQFRGPITLHRIAHNRPWAARGFRWIKTSIRPECFDSDNKRGWTPNFPSSFFEVPHVELTEFEDRILVPYFDLTLAAIEAEEAELAHHP
jgi:hypothetical protein